VCFSEVAVEVPFKLMHPKPDPGELITYIYFYAYHIKSYMYHAKM